MEQNSSTAFSTSQRHRPLQKVLHKVFPASEHWGHFLTLVYLHVWLPHQNLRQEAWQPRPHEAQTTDRPRGLRPGVPHHLVCTWKSTKLLCASWGLLCHTGITTSLSSKVVRTTWVNANKQPEQCLAWNKQRAMLRLCSIKPVPGEEKVFFWKGKPSYSLLSY